MAARAGDRTGGNDSSTPDMHACQYVASTSTDTHENTRSFKDTPPTSTRLPHSARKGTAVNPPTAPTNHRHVIHTCDVFLCDRTRSP